MSRRRLKTRNYGNLRAIVVYGAEKIWTLATPHDMTVLTLKYRSKIEVAVAFGVRGRRCELPPDTYLLQVWFRFHEPWSLPDGCEAIVRRGDTGRHFGWNEDWKLLLEDGDRIEFHRP